TEYPNAQCGLGETPDGPGGTCNRKGETPAFSPKWKYALGAEWVQPIGGTSLDWSLRADYAWVDDQNLIRVTVDEPGIQDAYGLLGLRAGIGERSGRWRLSAYLDNALDESYYVQATGQPTAALMSGGGVAPAGGFIGWYGPRRSWGLELLWRAGER